MRKPAQILKTLLLVCFVFCLFLPGRSQAVIKQLSFFNLSTSYTLLESKFSLPFSGDYLYFLSSYDAETDWTTPILCGGQSCPQIFRLHVITGDVAKISDFTSDQEIGYLAVSGDGSKLVLGRTDGMGVWTMNTDGTGYGVVTTVSSTLAPKTSISHDGTKIVFDYRDAATSSARCRFINDDGTGEKELLSLSGFTSTGCRIVPDGNNVIYTLGAYHISMYDLSNDSTTDVTQGIALYNSSLIPSLDGTMLYGQNFVSSPPYDRKLFAVSLDDLDYRIVVADHPVDPCTNPTNINRCYPYLFQISPDGSRYAYFEYTAYNTASSMVFARRDTSAVNSGYKQILSGDEAAINRILGMNADASRVVFVSSKNHTGENPNLKPQVFVWHDDPKLTVETEPQQGGSVYDVPSSQISCGYSGTYPNGTIEDLCDKTVPFGSEVMIEAQANENYAFDYWEWEGGEYTTDENPLTLTMNGPVVVRAVFRPGFQCKTDNFSVTEGDECVIYVRNELGIPYEACHGEAADCFDQASAYGFETGTEVRDGAIIVFDRVPNTALSVGHVGIVTSHDGNLVSMHDSNWVGYHMIGNHTEVVGQSGFSIKGYIYCSD